VLPEQPRGQLLSERSNAYRLTLECRTSAMGSDGRAPMIFKGSRHQWIVLADRD
jgi:hypothetical protein